MAISTSQMPVARTRRRGKWVAHGFSLAALGLWWLYSQTVPAYQLPGPGLVAAGMWEIVTTATLRRQLMMSFFHVVSSIGLAFVIGLALAMAAQSLWPLRRLIDGRITPFLNAFSGIGWLFLSILWFGVNSTTVIFAVTMILIPFSVINIRTGLIELDGEIRELGRSLTRNRWMHFRLLTLPMLAPYFFATLRTSFGVAWKVVLTAELFGGNAGIGYQLNVARQEFDTEIIFAIIAFIIAFVYLVEVTVFAPMQRRIARRFSRD
ncbi:ABC transporter permease [Pararhizobium haloflavum]|uniref:ABC transporter permease n=1 Tax=Pararhizobium haloflavum TaxID=2037914 RepID=UPI0012FFD95E|nr:ABC transporter permease subunit [Pararhizobium haloflavum]